MLTADADSSFDSHPDFDPDGAPAAAGEPAVGTLELYLAEIGRHKLLTRAEEIQLAKRIEAGDQDARQRMIEANLRLVVVVAKKYRYQGLDFVDLIQEGSLGLMQAVDRYDWRRDVKFSSYAVWWIRSAIGQALSNTSRTIRLSVSLIERMRAIRRAEGALVARLGYQPSDDQVAKELGLEIEQVLEARWADQPTMSLEATMDSNGELPFQGLLADEAAESPSEHAAKEVPNGTLTAALAQLPDRRRRVLELRYGLDGGEPRTVQTAASELGITGERVRQLELGSLRQLSANAGLRSLREAA